MAWLVTAPARAQDDEHDDPGELLRDGVALAEDGDHAAAVEFFRRVRVLEPSDRIDLNLASSLARLDRFDEAERLLERLARDESVNPLIADLAREELASLRARMTPIDVFVSPVPENAWLMVDGRRRGEAQSVAVIHLGPGAHRLAIIDGNTVLARAQLDVARGDRERRVLRLAPVAAAPEAMPLADVAPLSRPLPNPEPEGEVDPWPWVGVGAGVVAVTAIAIVVAIFATAPSHTEGDVPPVHFPHRSMP